MSDWRIRRSRDVDTEALVDVWERARHASLPWLEARMGYTHAQNLAFFRDVIAVECEIFLAERASRVIGFHALQGDLLDRLYVDPDAQGRGVGSALLDDAKRRRPTGLTLFTHRRNENARAFYERRGFVAVRFGVSPPPESEPDVEYCWPASREPDEDRARR